MDAIRHCMWYFMFWFIMEMQKGFLSTIAWNLAFFVEINYFFRVIVYELNKIIFQACHSNQENKLQKKVVIFSETCLNWLYVAYLKKFSKLLLIHTNLACNNWNSPSITNVIGSQHNKIANYFSFLFERLIYPLKMEMIVIFWQNQLTSYLDIFTTTSTPHCTKEITEKCCFNIG